MTMTLKQLSTSIGASAYDIHRRDSDSPIGLCDVCYWRSLAEMSHLPSELDEHTTVVAGRPNTYVAGWNDAIRATQRLTP
jgi:hypothetical protein